MVFALLSPPSLLKRDKFMAIILVRAQLGASLNKEMGSPLISESRMGNNCAFSFTT